MSLLKQYVEAYTSDFVLRVEEIIGPSEEAEIKNYLTNNVREVSFDDAMAAGEFNARHELPRDTQVKIINDAKAGDKGAILYCLYRVFPKIYSSWKMYLGQDAKHRVDKDKSEYYSLAYLALAGDFSKFNQGLRTSSAATKDSDYLGLRKNALEYLDLSKIASMSPFQALAYEFSHCLNETIKMTIYRNNANGVVDLENKEDTIKGLSGKFISMDQEIENDKSGAATIGEKIKDDKNEDFDSEISNKYILDDFTDILMGKFGDELYSDLRGHLPDDPKFTGVSPLNVLKVILDLPADQVSGSMVSKELGKRLGKSGIVQPATWGVWDKATDNAGALGVLKSAIEYYDMQLDDFISQALKSPTAFKNLIDECAEPSWLESPLYIK